MRYKVKVYHGYYGCDTGCCGHYVEIQQEGKTEIDVGNMSFSHPYGHDFKEWAIELAKEKIGKKFPECLDSIDWESIDISEVLDD